MNRISVLIPDADVRLNVARCLTASRQAIVHGFALHPAPLLRHSKFFASFEEYKGEFKLGCWLSRIGEIVAERRIDVVLPISEFAIKTLSEHRQALSWATTLPQLPDPHSFDKAIDKAKLADFLGSHGLPHPPTVVVTSGVPVHDRLSALEFPVLATPPLSSGGIGIRRFESLEGLAGFFAQQPSDERWVVQTIIEGRDVGVNVLCRDGWILAATVQHAIKESSNPFESPIGIEFRDDPPAMNVAKRLIHELGWSGVANIDMRYDARHKSPIVLELNGRYWFSLLGSLNAGVNFPLLACEMCLGEIKANRKPHKARYFSRKESALLSLLGGGRFGIRPHETDLRYLDPLPATIALVKSAAASARASFSRIFARVGGSV
jgi:predicted ATP-grasp superfamily ATP-dependent carboligase